jgi:hypothetical protein
MSGDRRRVVALLGLVVLALVVASTSTAASRETRHARADGTASPVVLTTRLTFASPSATSTPVPSTPVTSRERGRVPFWGPEEAAGRRLAKNRHRYYFGAIAIYRHATDAVWDVPAPGDHRYTRFRFATRDTTGHWSSAQTIARTRHWQWGNPNLVAGPKGTALLTWITHSPSMTRMMEVHRGPDGAWSPPHTLNMDPNGGSLTPPKAVIDLRGVASAIWSDQNGHIATASLRNGQWSDVTDLGPGGQGVIAVNRHSRLAVAFSTNRGLATTVSNPDGTWEPTHPAPAPMSYDDPHVAIDDHGRVLAMVTRNIENEACGSRHIAWTRSRLSGSWTPTQYLDTQRRPVCGTTLDVAMNAAGQAFAMWSDDMGFARNGDLLTDVSVARYRPLHGWARPRHVMDVADPHAMITPDGTAVALNGYESAAGRLAWGYQRPGGRWHAATVDASSVNGVDGGNWRMAILYNGPRLKARILHIPPARH